MSGPWGPLTTPPIPFFVARRYVVPGERGNGHKRMREYERLRFRGIFGFYS